jgi:hypothetical protein
MSPLCSAQLKAGLKTVVTVNAYTQQDEFSGALLVLDQLGEPGAAFSVLSGKITDASYVDVQLLRRIFAA